MDILQSAKHLSTGEKAAVAVVAAVAIYFGWDWYKGKQAHADDSKPLPAPAPTADGSAPVIAKPSATGGPMFKVTTQQSGVLGSLNVRSGPGINFGTVSSLPKNSIVQASKVAIQSGPVNSGGTSGDWALLLDPSGSGATLGWASMNYLTPVAASPGATAAATPADYLPAGTTITPDLLQRMKDAGVQV